jgi:CBS-domain-containing membrane protein
MRRFPQIARRRSSWIADAPSTIHCLSVIGKAGKICSILTFADLLKAY